MSTVPQATPKPTISTVLERINVNARLIENDRGNPDVDFVITDESYQSSWEINNAIQKLEKDLTILRTLIQPPQVTWL